MNDENAKAFLRALTKLSNKHQILIWGCGCCASPLLRSFEETHVHKGQVSPLAGTGRYVTEARNGEEYAYLSFDVPLPDDDDVDTKPA